MKAILYLFVLSFLLISCNENQQRQASDIEDKIQESAIAITARNLAQEQLEAYNNRDIEAFLKPYAEDVEIYYFPDELIYAGKEKMREGYSKMFEKTPNLHCTLVKRMVKGNIAIDEESVVMGDKVVHAIAMYEIENDKIQKVYFVK